MGHKLFLEDFWWKFRGFENLKKRLIKQLQF
jgi:hypothetical protein